MNRRREFTSVAVAFCCAIFLSVMALPRTAAAQGGTTGGCCDINSNCINTDQCTCIAGGGFWQGPASPCMPGTQCSIIAGACCTSNGCTYVQSPNCATIGGTFLAGQICNVAICPPQQTGSCCCRLTNCVDTDQDLCTLLGGTFSPGQTCANSNPCGGACCGPAFGQCTIVPQNQCVAPQTWIGTASCTPNPCIPSTFVACCFNGSCSFGSYCDCVFKNGIPFVGQPCNAAACAQAAAGACCTVNGICVVTNATVCSQYLGGTSFIVGGSCPSAACQNNTPVACCCQGACKLTDPKMCQLSNGTTLPAGTLCQPDPCNGACCNTNTGACAAPVSQQQCQAAGGTFIPGVTSCQPDPCTGACCDPATGNCFQTTQIKCTVPPFLFFGLGSVCTPALCHPTGACCDIVTGVCTIVTTQCPSPNDIYMGPNTTCTPNPCVVCCNPATGACSMIPAGSNACPNNTIQTPGLACTPNNPCPPTLGACCTVQGCIVNVTQAQCPTPGYWQGPGTTCTPNLCRGACCNPQTGFCIVTAANACPFPVPPPFLFLQTCTPFNPCPQPPPTGACCDPKTGVCQIVNAGACPAYNVYLGNNSTCTPNPCVICCNTATGACSTIPAGSNACPTGFTQLPGFSCTPNPCIPPGACCTPQGTCFSTTPAGCAAPNVYLGNGTTCTTGACFRCCNATTGACTSPIVFFGFPFCPTGYSLVFGATCTPNPCPPPGACCKPNGQCVQSTQANCVPGVWLGAGTVCKPNTCYKCCLNGQCYTPFVFAGTFACISGSTVIVSTTCTPNPCPPPIAACCFPPNFGFPPTGSMCLMLTQTQCQAQGGQWKGIGSVCQSPPGNFIACCKANFNGTGGVTVQDLFAYLGAFFAQFNQCGPNPPFTADFNGDGCVTLQDLFDFLGAWFTKCK